MNLEKEKIMNYWDIKILIQKNLIIIRYIKTELELYINFIINNYNELEKNLIK